MTADYLIAADGSRSAIRSMLGLEFEGEVFQDHFLIADIRMKAERPSERWFWFDPPFARGQSALLHKQPDDVWRLDFQLGWNIDRDAELDHERVTRRVRRMLGEDAQFELEWSSIYTFQCRRLDRFVHDRVIFAGDAAHLVSPFGARGANGGVQDIDNLCWKLALVQQGVAPRALLDELRRRARARGARRTSCTRPAAPTSSRRRRAVSRAFRDAVLSLARDHPFARAYVNSGRLSLPATLRDSPLLPPGGDTPGTSLVPGSPAPDAPIRVRRGAGWLLKELGGGFTLLCFGAEPAPQQPLTELPVPVEVVRVLREGSSDRPGRVIIDSLGKLAADLQSSPNACLLFRPDQHLAAIWQEFDPERVCSAVMHCIGRWGKT